MVSSKPSSDDLALFVEMVIPFHTVPSLSFQNTRSHDFPLTTHTPPSQSLFVEYIFPLST